MTITTYNDWCRAQGCDHGHCPCQCEHPQPFVLADGRCVCGRCAIVDGYLCDMVPCTPRICGED